MINILEGNELIIAEEFELVRTYEKAARCRPNGGASGDQIDMLLKFNTQTVNNSAIGHVDDIVITEEDRTVITRALINEDNPEYPVYEIREYRRRKM
jgi:hypothetical protein